MDKRILVPVGSTPQADLAVEYAVALAAFTGAELWLLQVPMLPVFASGPCTEDYSRPVIEAVIEASEYTLTCAMTAAEAAGVPYTATRRWGALPDMLIHTAAEADCDLIVLGVPEGSRWYHCMRRYVIETVIAQTRQPVLVVRPTLPPMPEPAHWSRLLVVIDDAAEAETAMEYALTLAQGDSRNVCLLHDDTASRAPAVRFANRTRLVAAACATLSEMPGEFQRMSGSVVHTILQTATRRQCDAIILSLRQASGWKRWLYSRPVSQVIARSPLPVFLLNRAMV